MKSLNIKNKIIYLLQLVGIFGLFLFISALAAEEAVASKVILNPPELFVNEITDKEFLLIFVISFSIVSSIALFLFIGIHYEKEKIRVIGITRHWEMRSTHAKLLATDLINKKKKDEELDFISSFETIPFIYGFRVDKPELLVNPSIKTICRLNRYFNKLGLKPHAIHVIQKNHIIIHSMF